MHAHCPPRKTAGMASVALVLSLLVPDVGNWWYLLTLAAPAAWLYYFQRGERVEEVSTGARRVYTWEGGVEGGEGGSGPVR